MGFSGKNPKRPVEDISGKIPGRRVKVVGIPEGYVKILGKNVDFQGKVNGIKWKVPGGHDKID